MLDPKNVILLFGIIVGLSVKLLGGEPARAEDPPPSIQTAFVDFLHCKQNIRSLLPRTIALTTMKFPITLEFFSEVVPSSPQSNDALLIETFLQPLANLAGKKLAIQLKLELTATNGVGTSSSGHTVFSFPRNLPGITGKNSPPMPATLTLDGVTEDYSCILAGEE